MSAGENQIVVYQPNETVRLESGLRLLYDWAAATLDLLAKKCKGVKEAA